jgi:diadenosine tetraphosphate (Ap4A) HIT family hydrolase
MGCHYCQDLNPKDLVHQTKHWNILIADNQTYLGRCVVALKRHCEALSDLKKEEWDEFMQLVKMLEPSLKKTFNATMFNWTCLMNNAYSDKNPKPHVHWHFRPRYNHKVEFAGLVFEDLEFGHRYDGAKKREVSPEIQKKIILEIKNNLSL